jgi:hypothetical protein
MTYRLLVLSLVLAMAAGHLTFWPDRVVAQEASDAQKARKLEQEGSDIVRDPSGIVRVRYERGGKISVGNRTAGPIVVIGWDRDFIEASALSDRGIEAVRAYVDQESSGARIALKAVYAENDEFRSGPGHRTIDQLIARRQAAQDRRLTFGRLDSGEGRSEPTPSAMPDPSVPLPAPVPPLSLSLAPDFPSKFSPRPGELFLEVKVPRYAEIDLITVIRSEVLVSGVETAITVGGEKSAIKLKRVGSAQVRTRGGDVEVEDSDGLVDVITTSGAIAVKGARTDVRALSISGRIDIQCARGRVDVSNTDGPITLTGVGGDVSATGANSNVRLNGPIRAEGRYYLKSMSGSVEMEAPANSPGFTVTLSSYRGGVETDFPLKAGQYTANKSKSGAPGNGALNRRLIGRYGNGQAQITLDSFDGTVRLSKTAAGALKDCR